MATPWLHLSRAIRRLRALWWNVAHRADADRELDDELEAYVALMAARNERGGLSPRDAHRAAVLAVGGVQSTKEATRDAWTGNALLVALRETRQTLRSLARVPLYAATIILTLAITIGSATALFTVVKGSLLRPLPAVADPDRLVSLEPMRNGKLLYDFSYPDYEDLRKASSLSGLALFDGTPMPLRDSLGVLRPMVSYVGGEFFSVLGVKPALGRLLDTTDVGPHTESAVVVISYDIWQRHFNGSPNAIGARITLNTYPMTVVGVAPKGFVGAMAMHAMDAWVPVGMPGPRSPTTFERRDVETGRLVGRLAPGKTLDDARAELTTIAERLAKTYVEDRDRTIVVYPGAAMTLEERADASRMPRLLAVAITLLLLITCANVANLSLMRTSARRRELATRLALGASRASLVARLLLESAILAGVAALAGIVLALVLVRSSVLVSMIVDMDAMDLSLDWRVVALTTGLAALAMLLVALASAAETMRVPVESLLRDGAGAVRKRSRKQRALVVVQVGASLVLLVTSASVLGSVRHSMKNDTGLDPRGVGMTFLSPHNAGLDSGRQIAYYRDLLASVSSEPSVGAAAFASTVPPAEWAVPSRVFRRGEEPAPGVPLDKGEHAPTQAYVDVISPGFFDVLRIPIVLGRDFLATDDVGVEAVAIVSRRLADALWPGESPIGKYVVRPKPTGPPRPALRVVGVAGDVRYAGVASEPAPTLYVAYRQYAELGNLTLITRGRGSATVPDTLVRDASRRLAAEANPGLAKPLIVQISNEFAPQRRVTGWLGAFGAIALVLAALGLYGVIAQDVLNRRRELAVRAALGASPGSLVALILGDGLRLTGAGVVLGAVAAFGIVRVVRALFTAIEHFDPLAGLIATAFLICVALLASYIPAAGIARIDITRTLRAD